MELALATAIGVLTAIGIYLLLRARSFDVILGMTFLSYATNLLIFAGGRVVLGKAPVLQEGVDSHLGNYTDPLPQALVLTAIVIAGGAGLQLGMKLLAPGRRSRLDALVDGGRIGARLCLGVAFMLLVAAFIEAFWSSIAEVPAWTKFGVAGVLWAGVLLWLWRGGRGGGHAH